MPINDAEIVTASEIAAFVYCPEAFRLNALGHKPVNQSQLDAVVAVCQVAGAADAASWCDADSWRRSDGRS